MTRKSHPDNVFITQSSHLKVETDAVMAKRFAEACKRLEVTQAVVLRQIIWEFITEAETDGKGGAH